MATRDFWSNNFRAARSLRRVQTPTEASLWRYLRNRQLDGYKFRRQHPVGRFVVDFYCPEAQLAIEIDGAVHLDPATHLLDADRQELMEERGIRFLRLSAEQVEQQLDHVLEAIAIAARATPPLHASGEGAGG